jgi:hypothetical protein
MVRILYVSGKSLNEKKLIYFTKIYEGIYFSSLIKDVNLEFKFYSKKMPSSTRLPNLRNEICIGYK